MMRRGTEGDSEGPLDGGPETGLHDGEDMSRGNSRIIPSDVPTLGKIEEAQRLYKARAGELEEDRTIVSLLEELRLAVGASARVSGGVGVGAACRRCDEDEGGSCCGAGIENRYTPVLLLMSLLLGVDLPVKRRSPESCFFLGTTGCILLARDVLCINYLCLNIQRMLDREDLMALQEATGKEMETVFALNESIKRKLRLSNSQC